MQHGQNHRSQVGGRAQPGRGSGWDGCVTGQPAHDCAAAACASPKAAREHVATTAWEELTVITPDDPSGWAWVRNAAGRRAFSLALRSAQPQPPRRTGRRSTESLRQPARCLAAALQAWVVGAASSARWRSELVRCSGPNGGNRIPRSRMNCAPPTTSPGGGLRNPAGAIDRTMGSRVRQHREHPRDGHRDSEGWRSRSPGPRCTLPVISSRACRSAEGTFPMLVASPDRGRETMLCRERMGSDDAGAAMCTDTGTS
jgi:hypothetical protein